MKCFNCNKKIIGKPIKQEPNRHMCSPNSFNYGVPPEEKYYEKFCSEECRKKLNKKRYAWFANLDRNASDSECFIHDHWETMEEVTGYGGLFPTSYDVKARIGHCKITGKKVIVIPLTPAESSGQPRECTEHFVLRKQYQNNT